MHANAEAAGVDERLERHRVRLTAFCRRMLGPNEAEDAVQETFLRAWRSFDRFECRSALHSWLHRIAMNVCLDMIAARKSRARPIDVGVCAEWIAKDLDSPSAIPSFAAWSDDCLLAGASPEEAVIERESVRRAFVAALEHLPPKQRAVLILREVLRWQAREVAELLDTTVPAVNSALQRARTTLRTRDINEPDAALDVVGAELVTRYTNALADHDIDAFVTLLNSDARRGRHQQPELARPRRRARNAARRPSATRAPVRAQSSGCVADASDRAGSEVVHERAA